MTARSIVLGVAAALLSGLVAYQAWHVVQARDAQVCAVCQRPIHAHTRTVATVDGNRTAAFCCPACALSERQQSGRVNRVVELTDYATGATLQPARAVIVRGSDVVPCAEHDARVDADKQPMRTEFDRCAPSLLAFATRDGATAFARSHGGEVLAFADLAGDAR